MNSVWTSLFGKDMISASLSHCRNFRFPPDKKSHVAVQALRRCCPRQQTWANFSSFLTQHGSSSTTTMDKPLAPTLGQHFLESPEIVSAIVEAANVQPSDLVLEIGPGTGNMTQPLLERAQQVMALEYDLRMVEAIKTRLKDMPLLTDKLQIIRGDALGTPWPYFDLLVANLPYQISSHIIYKLLYDHQPTWRCAVLMFQEEFAQRLVAHPGDGQYGRLTVNTKLVADVELLLPVGRENFRPPPQVKSRVVRIVPKSTPPPVDLQEWDGMTRLLFSRKNRTIRAILKTRSVLQMIQDNFRTASSSPGSAQDAMEEILHRKAWEGRRAGHLGMDELFQLLSEFNQVGIYFSSQR